MKFASLFLSILLTTPIAQAEPQVTDLGGVVMEGSSNNSQAVDKSSKKNKKTKGTTKKRKARKR